MCPDCTMLWYIQCFWAAPILAQHIYVDSQAMDCIAPASAKLQLSWCTYGCRSLKPLDVRKLPFPGDLYFVLVNPVFEAPTMQMRAALPEMVSMADSIANCSQGGSLVSAMTSRPLISSLSMHLGVGMVTIWQILFPRWFPITSPMTARKAPWCGCT